MTHNFKSIFQVRPVTKIPPNLNNNISISKQSSSPLRPRVKFRYQQEKEL